MIYVIVFISFLETCFEFESTFSCETRKFAPPRNIIELYKVVKFASNQVLWFDL